jgi:hypothetical protein
LKKEKKTPAKEAPAIYIFRMPRNPLRHNFKASDMISKNATSISEYIKFILIGQ